MIFSFKTMFAKLFSYQGASSRAEWWISFGVFLVLSELVTKLFSSYVGSLFGQVSYEDMIMDMMTLSIPYEHELIVASLYFLVGLVVVSLNISAVSVRRLRDAGRPTSYIYISLVPIVQFWLIYVLGFEASLQKNEEVTQEEQEESVQVTEEQKTV